MGQIVNFLAIDIEHFREVVINIQMFWSSPFLICVSFLLLWRQLGWASLPGVGISLLIILLNTYLVKKTKIMQVIQI